MLKRTPMSRGVAAAPKPKFGEGSAAKQIRGKFGEGSAIKSKITGPYRKGK